MNPLVDAMKRAVAQYIALSERGDQSQAEESIELLNSCEERLSAFLRDKNISTADKIRAMSEDLTWVQCYGISAYGIGLAVSAVRNANKEAFKCGLIALVAAGPKLDWRDLLGDFSMFECCGNHLGISFQEELSQVVKYGNENKLRATIEGFFSRSAEMRSVKVFGIVESGIGDSWGFAPMDHLS